MQVGSLKHRAHTKQLFQLLILDVSATRLTALVSLFICTFPVTSACQTCVCSGCCQLPQFLFRLAKMNTGVLTKGVGQSSCESTAARDRQRSRAAGRNGLFGAREHDAMSCRRCDEPGAAVRAAPGVRGDTESQGPCGWKSPSRSWGPPITPPSLPRVPRTSSPSVHPST